MAGMFENDFIYFSYPFPSTSQFNNGGSDSIENWNTANVTDMSRMFFRAENFNYNLAGWILNQDVTLTEMLDRSGLDCKNYSQTIIGWNNNPTTPNNKVLGATFMEYGPEAQPAINNMIINKGWGFSGHDFLSVTPEFDLNTTFCEGSTIPALPTASQEGIAGTWSPAINTAQTTTYTFVPEAGECATATTVTLTIGPLAVPTGVSPQPFVANSTLSDIVISPASVVWYASSEDALNDINPLSLDTLLEDGMTYYAVNDNGECRSQYFPVTVSNTLSIGSNDLATLEYYPNPVSSVLTIVSKTAIDQVAVYNLQGQKVLEQRFDGTVSVTVDLKHLPESIYLIRASSGSLVKEFKIVKQ
ncbi:T9SS type A sorting domain-containing protein [Flavobacterium sp. RHBU_24]|uniref:T9SS type A sorting domain-containing protein n=1 Tax=Flavobacterium sp. RHBU_24 TaxID=3391185 RepID=UPI003984B252